MQMRDLARLLIKIAGIVIIIGALSDLPVSFLRVMSVRAEMTDLELIGMTLAPAAISLSAGMLMFWLSGPIVDRALFSGPIQQESDQESLQKIEEVAIALLGVYVITSGLADAVYTVSKWQFYYTFAEEHARSSRIPIPQSEFASLCTAGVRIIVGLLMFARSRGLVKIRQWLHAQRPISSDT